MIIIETQQGETFELGSNIITKSNLSKVTGCAYTIIACLLNATTGIELFSTNDEDEQDRVSNWINRQIREQCNELHIFIDVNKAIYNAQTRAL